MAQLIWDAIRTILEREGIKERGGKWIGNAPSAMPANKRKSVSFVATPYPNMQNGIWNYTAGGRSGTFINSNPEKCLATILGIDKSEYTTTKYKAQNSAVETHLDYAKSHYVNWDVFEAAEWHVGKHPHYENRGMTIYMTCRDKAQRHRFFDGEYPKWRPYKTPEWLKENPGKGDKVKPQWYGLDKATSMDKGVIVICNGQPSTVVAQHYDVPACAVTDGENKTPPSGLIAELKRKWQGKIIIAMDCDTAGKEATNKWKAALPHAMAVDLNGTDGFDLADHCGLFTDKSFQMLLDYAKFTGNAEIADKIPQKQLDPIRDASIAARELANAIKGDEQLASEAMKNMKRLVDEYEAQTYGVTLTTGTDDAVSLHNTIEDRFKKPQRISGLTTSFKSLDYALGGWKSEIYSILAIKGIGKSTLMASIATDLMMQSNGIILPTEMQRKDFIMMMLARMASTPDRPISTYALQTKYLRQWDITKDPVTGNEYTTQCDEQLNEDDKKRIRSAYKILYGEVLSKGKILWPSTAAPNAQALYMTIAKRKEKDPNLKWLMIDSFTQLGGVGAGSDIRTKLNDIMYMLVRIATELDICVIQSVQIGRSVKNRDDKRPQDEDAAETGIVEQLSAKLFGLYYHHHYVVRKQAKPNVYLPEGVASLSILKGRFVGDGTEVKLLRRGGAGFWHYSNNNT